MKRHDRRPLLVLLCALLFASCAREPYVAAWSSPANSDTLDFSYLDMNGSSEAGLYYKILHNDSSLVIECAILDEFTQQKVLMNGLTVWVDTNDRAAKKTGFVFPFHGSDREDPTSVNRSDPFQQNGRPMPPEGSIPPGYLAIIKNQIIESDVYASGTVGLKAQLILNANNVLMYRVAIDTRLLGLSKERMSGTPFSIVLTTTGLSRKAAPDPTAVDQSADDASVGRPVMHGSQNQTPYGQTSMGSYGYPGGGTYYGHTDTDPTQSRLTRSDRIVIRNIVFEPAPSNK